MITVVGGGFAGCEASWVAANAGERVRLYEMRPSRMTPAHKTDLLAELVCSNSFKSSSPASPAGLLKAEMVALGSLMIPTAEQNSVPGGEALAVDRNKFARAMTAALEAHHLIEIVRCEFTPAMAEAAAAEGPLIIATGPLTSPDLAAWLAELTGKQLYFYDAVSPTVEAATLDRSIVFAQSRYDKGGDDYLNCPFDKETYQSFVHELVTAERAPIHAFEVDLGDGAAPTSMENALIEKIKYFAGCTPIEAIAEKGERSLAFGNFKPVGLTDPRTGRRPYAVLQLRPENREGALYSLVACQTRLKWGEQKRVFRMVPGLENAVFVRYGVIHRNIYVDAPRALTAGLELKAKSGVFLAGQITGVEGYVESGAMGILAGMQAVQKSRGMDVSPPPRACALGGLIAHLQNDVAEEFSPMNVNWGLFPPLAEPSRDKGARRDAQMRIAKEAFEVWLAEVETNR